MNTQEAPTRTEENRCVHHWAVEPAAGPTSKARCRRCGEKREFSNSPDAVTYEVKKQPASAAS